MFWNRILADKAKYSCLHFYADEGHQNIELDKWHAETQKGKIPYTFININMFFKEDQQ